MLRSELIRAVIMAFVAGLAALFSGGAFAQSNSLFVPVAGNQFLSASSADAGRLRQLQTSPTTETLQLVRVNLDALDAASTTLLLPGAGATQVNKRNTQIRSASDYTWVGDIPATGGQAILVVRNGDITGLIQNGLEQYSVNPIGNGVHALIKVDQSAFPEEHPQAPRMAPGQRSDFAGGAPVAAASVRVDILVAYTAAARVANANIAATAQLAVDAANIAYSNSNADVVLRLVGTMEVAYTETTFNAALDALTNGTGVMAQVHTRRNQTGADLVSLFTNIAGSCGLGWVNSPAAYAFSAVKWDCAVGNYSLAHELGHNFGALHDPAVDPSTTPYAYGHGYVFTNQWRTIMAYPDACGSCPRLQYFSNPDVLYQAAPMGNAILSNVARVHRERVLAVAAFRAPAAVNTGDFLADLGGSGLFERLNNAAWVKIHVTSPSFIAAGDLDGGGKDEAIAAFAGAGLWARYNNTNWVKLHNSTPLRFVAGDVDGTGKDDIAVDFGASGLWLRLNNASWLRIHTAARQDLAIGDLDGNNKDDVVVDFGSVGLWAYFNRTTWVKLHATSPLHIATGDFDGNGVDDVVADFASFGTFARYNNATWQKLHASVSSGLATGDLDGNGKDELLIDFGSSGFWGRFNNTTWLRLHNLSPGVFAAGDVNGNGKEEIICDLPGTGLWVRYDSGTWTNIHASTAEALAVGGFD